jgi:hypothetical protein
MVLDFEWQGMTIQGVSIMKRSHWKPLTVMTVLIVCLGASFAATADSCRFAYDFCMPRYYACIASGTPQDECHQELDACLLRNGCSNMP